ncbi:MAG: FtsW/RodA/SpoVE family cell cycle protein, partial [Rhodospirillales bacterium]|nr:FtsW/RodA/SpoVE family cell cycle protein [Rhodospirillales bacterium]
MRSSLDLRENSRQSVLQRLAEIRWLFVFFVVAIASVGAATLYSAAGGSVEPWVVRQGARFGISLVVLIVVALTDIRLWWRLAYPFYLAALVMLVIVDFAGTIGMGAQRWINLGIINVQPSELMKVALALALARYFHGCDVARVRRPLTLIPPILLVLAPVALVLKQPDL